MIDIGEDQDRIRMMNTVIEIIEGMIVVINIADRSEGIDTHDLTLDKNKMIRFDWKNENRRFVRPLEIKPSSMILQLTNFL